MLSRQAARRYHPGEIYVTENGVDVPNENSLSLADALNDTFRVNFYQGYVQAAQQAVNDGVPLKGYFAWSLLGAPLGLPGCLEQSRAASATGCALSQPSKCASVLSGCFDWSVAGRSDCLCRVKASHQEGYDALPPMQSTQRQLSDV